MDAKSPTLQRLYRDWEAWRGSRAFPTCADIDPLKIRYILGNLSVLDVLRDPLRFFFRIHSTESVERAGYELTGKMLDALPNRELHDVMHNNLVRTLNKRAPLSIFHEKHVANKIFGDLEVLVLPFSADQQTIDVLAIGTHFDVPRRYWEQPSHVPASDP